MRSIVIGLVLALGVSAAACDHGGGTAVGTEVDSASPDAMAAPASVTHIPWRAMAVAGDDSAPVFDNAVDAMQRLLAARGVTRIDRFTSDPMVARSDRQIATAAAMATTLDAARPAPGQGCLVFITSHGGRHGVLMRDDLANRQILDPSAFGRILDGGCGAAPTVAIVSACFSGIFIGAVTEAPNRIILTAARDDRTSFGCGHEEQFTYFDGCMFQAWPKAQSWPALFAATSDCVRAKEDKLGFKHSEPQAFFGSQVAGLGLP
jgi:hypothetical protein